MPQLAKFILDGLAAKSGDGAGVLSSGAQQALAGYEFPGNVRELENILERAMAMCEGTNIDAADLMLPQRSAHLGGDGGGIRHPEPVREATSDGGLDDYITNLERTAIVKALEESRYNKTAAARKLGITFRALRYKLKKLGID